MSERLQINPTPLHDEAGNNIDASLAFDFEARQQMQQEQSDMATYLDTRLKQDANGSLHDPSNGAFANPDKFHDKQREEHLDGTTTPYEDMGMFELARELARAELSEDRTTTENISDILLDKLAKQSEKLTIAGEVKEGQIDKYQRDTTGPKDEVSPQDQLWDRVLGYKDAYKEKISTVSGGPTTEELIDQKRARINEDMAYDNATTLKDLGVEDEVIENMDDAYFYDSSDKDYKELVDDLHEFIPTIDDADTAPVNDTDTNPTDDQDQASVVDNSAERRQRRNEILEGLGIQKGRFAYMDQDYKLVTRETNPEVPEIVDAFDQDGEPHLRLKYSIPQEDGSYIHKEVVRSRKELLLATAWLERSDKRLLKLRRPRKSNDNDEYLEERGAELREQQRAELRAEQDGPKKPSWRDRTKLLVGRIMTGNIFNAKTDEEKKRNKVFAAVAAGAGVLAVAALSYKGIHALTDHHDTVQSLGTPKNPNVDLNNVPNLTDAPQGTGAGETVKAFKDTVKPGDGITRTFMDYAQEHGQKMSPAKAYEIFNQAKDAGLINEDNISNISSMDVTGGVGFNGAGSTRLSPELVQFLQDQLQS